MAAPLAELVEHVETQLQAVQDGMYAKAKRNLEEHTFPAYSLEEAKQIQQEKGGFIKTMWCGDLACELKMKEEGGMSSRAFRFSRSTWQIPAPSAANRPKR